MTTTDNMNAASIAAGLSASEREALRVAKAHKLINGSRTTANLRKLCEIDKLLVSHPHVEEGLLTDYSLSVLGEQVHAALQPDARPTTEVNRGKPSSLFFDDTELIDDSMPTAPDGEAAGEDIPNPFDELDSVGYAIAAINADVLMRSQSISRTESIARNLDTIETSWREVQAELTTLRNQLATANERAAKAESERDTALAKVKRLSRKSDLDEGFIDFLTAKDGE